MEPSRSRYVLMLPYNRAKGIQSMLKEMTRTEAAARLALGDFHAAEAAPAANAAPFGANAVYLLAGVGAIVAAVVGLAAF